MDDRAGDPERELEEKASSEFLRRSARIHLECAVNHAVALLGEDETMMLLESEMVMLREHG